MSDDRAFRINGEVIEVDITANPNASLADEDDALTSVELRLEDGHSDLRFWGASSEELTRLCDTLSHARSAVMATTHHGTSKTFATLMAGVRIALKSKSRMVHVPAGGDTISGNSTTHKPRATRPSPSVLIVVPDNERGQCVISLLNEIRSRLRLPLQVGEYLDSGGIQGYEETDDMSVLPCCEMYSRLIDWRPDMSGVRLIVWDEAHRTFGPDLRRLDYPQVYNRWHGSETVHCLKRCHSDTSLLFIGPRELGMSLSIIRDELLGNRGIKRSFMADETADDDRAPHNVGSDRDLPRWRGQIWATFSDLPGELRNRIYGCIMESGVVFELSMFRPAGGHMTCRPMCSSFVQFESLVNKQFAAETRPIFYAANIFKFDTMGSLNVFINSIGPSSAHLEQVRIARNRPFLYTKSAAVFRTVASLHNLRSFSFDSNAFIMRYRNCEAHKNASGISNVLDLVRLTDPCPYCAFLVETEEMKAAGRLASLASMLRPYPKHVRRCRRSHPRDTLSKMQRKVKERIAEVLGMKERAATGGTAG